MSGFSADWLALREPLDLAARNQEIEDAFFKVLPTSDVRILDLASGAGSTVAALSRRAASPIHWTLTDYDPDLLAIASKRQFETAPASLAVKEVDLSGGLEQLPLAQVDAATTSAFLDLVSEVFLQKLVEAITSAEKPFLASLTYDGRTSFEPSDPLDDRLLNALNTDQQTDKGFGPALGPKAASRAVQLFRDKGYKVLEADSDWKIQANATEFLNEFLTGWARVGAKHGNDQVEIDRWLELRSQQISEHALTMTVGHQDFVALPE